MANLTKRDIVVKISNDTGLVQHQVFEVVQRTLDLITDNLARGDDVELRNFGIFEVRLTKERVGRNPNQPGSSFKIPPRATVKFKAGKVMRQKVSKLSPTLEAGTNGQGSGSLETEPPTWLGYQIPAKINEARLTSFLLSYFLELSQ